MSTNLNGTLDLAGTLALREKVLVGGAEALVVLPARGNTKHATARKPVPIPSEAQPADPGTDIWIVSSGNRSVLAGAREIVTSGECRQGETAIWPGTVSPSVRNQGVRAGGTAVCVVGDQGQIDQGEQVTFTTSGQG